MNTEQVAILDRAIELISMGWCQGAYNKHTKSCSEGEMEVKYCLSGALGFPKKSGMIRANNMIRLLLQAEAGKSLVDFNDHPDRTQQEVIDLLKRVRDKVAGG